MQKFAITIIGETSGEDAPCIKGIKGAVDDYIMENEWEGRVLFIASAGEAGQIKMYNAYEQQTATIPTPAPAPKRTLWSNVPAEARVAFQQLADDWQEDIPMHAPSVEAAINDIPAGPKWRQAVRIYETYIGEFRG